MKKVFSTEDRIMAGHVQSILEDQGIASWIKNHNLAGAMGELPPIECWPEVWVSDDKDYPKAKKIVDDILLPESKRSDPWICGCGETIEAQFTACWQCGGRRRD